MCTPLADACGLGAGRRPRVGVTVAGSRGAEDNSAAVRARRARQAHPHPQGGSQPSNRRRRTLSVDDGEVARSIVARRPEPRAVPSAGDCPSWESTSPARGGRAGERRPDWALPHFRRDSISPSARTTGPPRPCLQHARTARRTIGHYADGEEQLRGEPESFRATWRLTQQNRFVAAPFVTWRETASEAGILQKPEGRIADRCLPTFATRHICSDTPSKAPKM